MEIKNCIECNEEPEIHKRYIFGDSLLGWDIVCPVCLENERVAILDKSIEPEEAFEAMVDEWNRKQQNTGDKYEY